MPYQRHASSILTPDFDNYPARPIASIDVHPLGLEVRYKDAKVAFIWHRIYANILLRMTQPMQLPGKPFLIRRMCRKGFISAQRNLQMMDL